MSMGKREAQKRAAEGGISIGDLRRMIAEERERTSGRGDAPSNVNPAFTKDRVLDILERGIASRPDEEVPDVWRAGNHLIIRNILREAG